MPDSIYFSILVSYEVNPQMIKRFSVLYVGQIDFEDVGAEATPADDRCYSNDVLIQPYYHAEELARHMDDLGFYCLWAAEHHFQREGYEVFPNLTLLGVHLAGITDNLKFGAGFNVVPMWHPIRLAEDFAMGDVMTRGRLIFGVGRGYQSREVETLGAPLIDQDANRAVFEENMEIILKAFNEESFSHKGLKHTIPADVPYRGYQMSDVTLVPRPVNLPVEIWQPITSGRSIEFMAKHGIKGMVALTGEIMADEMINNYHKAKVEIGENVSVGEDIAFGVGFYIADTKEEAIDKVRPYHDERYKWFAPFGYVRYTDEEGRPWGTPGAPARTPRVEDGVDQKAWFCGSPDDFISYLQALETKYPGLEDVVFQWPEGMPWLEFKDQLSIFAKEVMPAFSGASSGTVGPPADD